MERLKLLNFNEKGSNRIVLNEMFNSGELSRHLFFAVLFVTFLYYVLSVLID